MSSFLKKLLKADHAGVVASLMETAEKRDTYAGDPSLDWGIKGWHTGGINLIYGPSGCGKSALALSAAAETWKKNQDSYVVIYDSEFYYYKNKANYERIAQFGIPLDKVILIAHNTIAVLFESLPQLEEDMNPDKKTGKVALKVCAIIIDSLGGIQNQNAENKILKGESEAAGDAHRGNAKSMNPILGVFNRITAIHNIPCFIVQHCIKNQEMYGDKWVLLGGERLKFLSQRVVQVESSLSREAKLFAGDIPFNKDKPTEMEDLVQVGKKIIFKCIKSRGGMEGGKGEFFFNFIEARFAKPDISLFNLASKLDVFYHPLNEAGKPNNSWWAYNLIGKEIKAHGQSKMQEMLATDKELFARVLADCRASTKTSATDEQMSSVVSSDDGGDPSKERIEL